MVAYNKNRRGFSKDRETARNRFYAKPTVQNFFELEQAFAEENKDAAQRDGLQSEISKPERRTEDYVKTYYRKNHENYEKLVKRFAARGDRKAELILKTNVEEGRWQADEE